MVVVLHHPGGKLSKEDGSLAGNWELWNKHLNSILEIVSLEVAYLQKNSKKTDIIPEKNVHFFSLAAAVYFQVIVP